MKSLCKVFSFTVLVSLIYLTGCDLITKPPTKDLRPPPGNDLIVSEVFTLSPDKYYDYSWIEVYNPTRSTFKWFDQQYPMIGASVGNNGSCYYTDNNGVTWTKVPPPAGFENVNFTDISFAHNDSGIVITDKGDLLKIRKVGNALQFDPTPIANPDPAKKGLNDILLVIFAGQPSKAGFAVGDSGAIIRTTNRGASWNTFMKNRSNKNLHAFGFVDLTKMFAVGDSGAILKSTGTSTWTAKAPPDFIPPVPLRPNFNGIFFVNDTGIVVGDGGAIGATRNAGEAWTSRESNTTSNLRNVFFGEKGASNFDYKTGWIVGDNGTILKTTDLGETWYKIESPTTHNLRKVVFIDNRQGWILGEGGTILSSKDGGETWKLNQSFTTEDLLGIHVNPSNIRIRNRYVMEMLVKRKPFFCVINRVNPDLSVVNYEDTLQSDVGIALFDPQLYQDLPMFWGGRVPENLTPIFGWKNIKNIPPSGFTIVRNDSIRFSNHVNMGPGASSIVNASIAYVYDATSEFGVRWYLWDLLPYGEIRLVKYMIKEDRNTNQYLGYDKVTLDVVRWGDYMPTNWYLPYDSIPSVVYPNNKPAGTIPEWYSLARYANDVGQSDPNLLNTSESFYFAKDPIPGWYSQRRK